MVRWSVGRTGAIGARDRAGSGDVGPGWRGPMPAGSALGSASVEIAEGKGNRRETDGEPNRTATAEGTEPENAGRRETGRRRATGKNRAGQPGNRRKARTGT